MCAARLGVQYAVEARLPQWLRPLAWLLQLVASFWLVVFALYYYYRLTTWAASVLPKERFLLLAYAQQQCAHV